MDIIHRDFPVLSEFGFIVYTYKIKKKSGKSQVKTYFAGFLESVSIYFADSNSRKKRVSFSEKRRRSLTRYFKLVIRSTPIPNA